MAPERLHSWGDSPHTPVLKISCLFLVFKRLFQVPFYKIICKTKPNLERDTGSFLDSTHPFPNTKRQATGLGLQRPRREAPHLFPRRGRGSRKRTGHPPALRLQLPPDKPVNNRADGIGSAGSGVQLTQLGTSSRTQVPRAEPFVGALRPPRGGEGED